MPTVVGGTMQVRILSEQIMNISGKAGFRLDPRFGQSGSKAAGAKLDKDQRRRLCLCSGILTRTEAGLAFGIHPTQVSRIWKSNANHKSTPETTDSLGTDFG